VLILIIAISLTISVQWATGNDQMAYALLLQHQTVHGSFHGPVDKVIISIKYVLKRITGDYSGLIRETFRKRIHILQHIKSRGSYLDVSHFVLHIKFLFHPQNSRM